MTNLFRNSGPYEISISQYGSSLADLPIKFARQFGATFGAADLAIGAALLGFVLWGAVEYFTKTTPLKLIRGAPVVGKFFR
jgi:hypothetical protein